MEFFSLNRTVAPAVEPLSLAEAKEWVRVDSDDASQDATLNALIASARERFEDITRRALITQTWVMKFDRFPGLIAVTPDFPGWEYLRLGADGDPRVIRLARPPLIAVSSITYMDTAGATQTLDPASYLVDASSQLARVFPAYGTYWPVTRPQGAAVTITYTAGYGASATSVPASIKDRLKAWIGHCFAMREKQDDDYLDRLFANFVIGGYF